MNMKSKRASAVSIQADRKRNVSIEEGLKGLLHPSTVEMLEAGGNPTRIAHELLKPEVEAVLREEGVSKYALFDREIDYELFLFEVSRRLIDRL